jgi:5-methylcytosine-specific restriction protein A
MPWTVCNQHDCGTLIQKTPGTDGRCPKHRHTADQDRRPTGNPYTTKAHRTFRETVLTRDPICVLCRREPSTVADHYPTERKDLIAQGINPNDPVHGRGLCKRCHDKHTARTSPGGWNTPL